MQITNRLATEEGREKRREELQQRDEKTQGYISALRKRVAKMEAEKESKCQQDQDQQQ
jgi:hypothetical protein